MKIANGVESGISTRSPRDENKPLYELDVHPALLVATLIVCSSTSQRQTRPRRRSAAPEMEDIRSFDEPSRHDQERISALLFLSLT